MRLVTFDAGAGAKPGLLRDSRVVPLSEPPEGDVGSLLRSGLAVGGSLAAAGVALEDVTLMAPVTNPGKIVCIGLNYRSHAEEQGVEPPETPAIFAKFTNALAPPGAEVRLPPWSRKVDYEAEVAFVIGARCKDVSVEDAMEHVAGFTLLNDLSARDYQFKTPQWMPGKVFDGSAPCGPALVTPDEAGPHDAIE
jgi:2-keto-4-pentenoate hydratase/2-oxohepta-3-ene-1,7-dioic acid hydratase in catechol pathway